MASKSLPQPSDQSSYQEQKQGSYQRQRQASYQKQRQASYLVGELHDEDVSSRMAQGIHTGH